MLTERKRYDCQTMDLRAGPPPIHRIQTQGRMTAPSPPFSKYLNGSMSTSELVNQEVYAYDNSLLVPMGTAKLATDYILRAWISVFVTKSEGDVHI